ncbi:hypothetical protein [uncultured Vagococcus sp.]|nr:hypothetical protein [uncultured Vagococcus sp.]
MGPNLNYYKQGLKEIQDDWIEGEAPEAIKIKSGREVGQSR